MRGPGGKVARPVALFVALLAAACTGGCSWLLGIWEDPVAAELPQDGSADVAAEALDARDGAPVDPPDVAEAAVEDAPVE